MIIVYICVILIALTIASVPLVGSWFQRHDK